MIELARKLLDEEYRKESMDRQDESSVKGGFFNRRDMAAIRAIMKALEGNYK